MEEPKTVGGSFITTVEEVFICREGRGKTNLLEWREEGEHPKGEDQIRGRTERHKKELC